MGPGKAGEKEKGRGQITQGILGPVKILVNGLAKSTEQGHGKAKIPSPDLVCVFSQLYATKEQKGRKPTLHHFEFKEDNKIQ